MALARPEPADPKDAELARLRKRLRTCQRNLRGARAELAARPPAPEPLELTGAEIRHLHEQFTPSAPGTSCAVCGRAHPGPCSTCGGLHAHACPRVRSVEYEMHGERVLIKRVTYWKQWDKAGVMFADELPPLPGEG